MCLKLRNLTTVRQVPIRHRLQEEGQAFAAYFTKQLKVATGTIERIK